MSDYRFKLSMRVTQLQQLDHLTPGETRELDMLLAQKWQRPLRWLITETDSVFDATIVEWDGGDAIEISCAKGKLKETFDNLDRIEAKILPFVQKKKKEN